MVPDRPADPPCAGAAELGIVDYGHRATPDIYLNAAFATSGDWNSSQYSSPEFDAAFKEYQAAVDVEAQTAACEKIETILNEDVPVGLPYFYNYLSVVTRRSSRASGSAPSARCTSTRRPRSEHATIVLGRAAVRPTDHRRARSDDR